MHIKITPHNELYAITHVVTKYIDRLFDDNEICKCVNDNNKAMREKTMLVLIFGRCWFPEMK